MFKKTLVASALALAAFGSQAATLAITGTVVSQEGSAGAASIAVPTAVVTLAAEYTVNDEITFTVSGAEFDASSVPALAAAFAVEAGDGATFGFLSQTANTVTFRITAQTDGGVTPGVAYTGGTFTLTGMTLKTSTVLDATGDISVAYSAKTGVSGTAIDNTGTLTDVSNTVVAQFSSSVTKALNGIIDVENDRQQFTAGNDSTTTDVLVVTPVEAAAAVNDAAYTGATIAVKGDFSWMETDGDAGIDAGELAAAFAATGGADTYTSVINSAGDTITVTVADAGGNTVEAATLTFTNAGVGSGNAVLTVQDFTVSTTIKYNTAAPAAATKVTGTDAAAGSWTLNGSVVEVPYMPFGPVTQGILYHTNTGTKSGAISARYILEGESTWTDLGVVVTNASPGVTNLLTPVMDAVKTSTGLSAGKVALEITTNVPNGDVTITAAAKFTTTDSDRLTIGTFE
jgi:hypothetical protein